MKLHFLLILTVFSGFALHAQHRDFKINWTSQKNIAAKEGQSFRVPGFSSLHFSFNPSMGSITYTAQWAVNGRVSSYQLSNITYERLPKKLLKNLNLKAIPTHPELSLKTTKARNKSYAFISLSPIVNDRGVFKKITSFRINYQLTHRQRSSAVNNTPSITNSVLAQGAYFKFQIDKSGVYKLSKSFLNSLGMETANINPQKLKIYGFGGAMLPLPNSDTRYYDPPEVPIQVVGGNDGSFDEGDYILFYGVAAKGNWNNDSKTNLNLYADHAYYYITADGGNGKRISSYTPPSGNATTTITTFNDRDFYEVDQYNIGKVGRRWFGDRFDFQSQRTYEFNFPNIVQGSDVKLVVYAASSSESNTDLMATVNGTPVGGLHFFGINSEIFARSDRLSTTFPAQSDQLRLQLTYQNNGNPASTAYLDYINIFAERELIAGSKQFEFTYKEAATQSGIGKYHLENTADISQIWDITNPYQISRMVGDNQSNQIEFKALLGEERHYIAISPSDYYTPSIADRTRVDNINLKGTIFKGPNGSFQDVDYLIIAPQFLINQAKRLAQHRRESYGLRVKVVLLKDIYKEFNSGMPDISAIRNFVKYVYDNASSPANRLQYLCLFGDASIDYKNRLEDNNNIIPTYESLYSYSLRYTSTASDDFFGMMGDSEGSMVPSDKLDIAVGRILADSPETAQVLVDKIIQYDRKESYGPWRNNFVLISDDADVSGSGGAGLQMALDALSDDIFDHKPFINIKKIHSDAYEQVYTSGGQRYPEVNEAITNSIEVGATVVNYFGHGGENGLASEYIVTREGIKDWKNQNRMNVFVTVTCEFTRFDNPLRISPGELALLNDKGGSLALVSTIRTIPVYTGTIFNNQLAPFLFNYTNQGYSVAEAVRRTKNSISSGARRVVFFFGDPAMQLAFAKPKIELTGINGHPLNQPQDTLKALSKVKISGQVVTSGGNLLSNYTGTLTATVYDKPIERHTLGNDGSTDFNGNLIIMDFETLGNVIFRGKASVENGKFEVEFVVPKDIRMPVDQGRISFYSKKTGVLEDYRGYNNTILVGDINKNAPKDNKGPKIELYMNDENFVSGGITNDSPMIVAKLEDEHGINTSGGIGHDIIAYIDGDQTDPYVLNDYYHSEIDNYQKGTVKYNLHQLEKGPHTLTFKAWDVYNNSSTAEIQFVVADDEKLKITHVLNYPNPFHDYTEFWFNHNRPFEPLQVQVQVFTVSGKLVWSHRETIVTQGFLSRDISWNGRDRFGDLIGKGVYVYKLSVKSTLTNQKVEKYEKLVIL